MAYTPLFIINKVAETPEHPIVPGITLFEHEVLHYMNQGRRFTIKFITLIDQETMELYYQLERNEINDTAELTRAYHYHDNLDKTQGNPDSDKRPIT